MGTEASSNSTTIAGSDGAEGTATGLRRAVANADPVWMSAALQLIEHVAYTRGSVCACDIADDDQLGAPDHTARYGAAFHLSAVAGDIENVGHHRARRPSRHGGTHTVWQGVVA